jgi:dsRNA-specific ribonuclease
LPAYDTTQSGEAHAPVFISQVNIGGKIFAGQASKSKKRTEKSAAKGSYTTLKDIFVIEAFFYLFFFLYQYVSIYKI